jgi:DNA (cytosine-5)-methyltransferase 1
VLFQRESPKFIDLFAGCGGLSLGLMQAGWTGLFAIEKSPMAFETLKHNLVGKGDTFSYAWPDWLPIEPIGIKDALKNYQDNLKELQGIDLLAGGPPCQGYSLAGRRNVKDARNKLIGDYLDFVELIQPKLILLENVRTFATSFAKTERGKNGLPILKNQYNADQVLQKSLKELGYTLFVKNPVMAKDFGVPQLRPRYILIGIKTELLANDSKIDPFKLLLGIRKSFLEANGLTESEVPLSQAISDLKKTLSAVPCKEAGMKRFKQGTFGQIRGSFQVLMRRNRLGEVIAAGQVADSHRFANHKDKTVTRFQKIIDEFIAGKQLTKEQIESLGLQKHRVTLLSTADVCHTLTSLPDDMVHNDQPRILTVREYARIQSFPDWFEFKSNYTTGSLRRREEVPRYTQVANAVPPLLASALGMALIKSLELLESKPIPIQLRTKVDTSV